MKPKQWVIQKIKFISGDRYEAQFVGCAGTDVISRAETILNIPAEEQRDYEALFKVATDRGPNPKNWTWFIGNSIAGGDGPHTVGGTQVDSVQTDTGTTISSHPPVVHQSKVEGCVPYALLNVIGASKRKHKKLLRCFNGGVSRQGDLATLAFAARNSLKISLVPVMDTDVDWLLSQTNGQYVVVDGVHAVGVDCGKRLIFDCSKDNAMDLTKIALSSCGIHNVLEMRRIERQT